VIPYGSITVGERGETLAAYEEMADSVAGFSDDGVGVQNEALMLEAMRRAAAIGKPIVAHCEDKSLLFGGYIHDGDYARAHGHRGISSESEWRPIARDIELLKQSDCAYHVCHVSTKESVALIREAKKNGVNITCETAPHYLVMDDGDLQENGRFKMNPPLRSPEDRKALVEGLLDGTIDMIATDHAPHSAVEKAKGLENSAFGVVGLETAFPILYTYLVKTGILTLERLVALMADNPRRRFGITSDAGFSVWNVEKQYKIDPDRFASMGRATPFAGKEVFGENLLTVYQNKIVYQNISEN
jgi:dihydroorotase